MITLVYKRKGHARREANLNNETELGKFIIYNEPLEVIAVRIVDKPENSAPSSGG